jgi:hypothetical protein
VALPLDGDATQPDVDRVEAFARLRRDPA